MSTSHLCELTAEAVERYPLQPGIAILVASTGAHMLRLLERLLHSLRPS